MTDKSLVTFSAVRKEDAKTLFKYVSERTWPGTKSYLAALLVAIICAGCSEVLFIVY